MDEDRLSALIEQPEVQQRILGPYEGGYSLGLTVNPENRSEIAIRVRVEGEDVNEIPRQVVLEGETVPVIVSPNFRVPEH